MKAHRCLKKLLTLRKTECLIEFLFLLGRIQQIVSLFVKVPCYMFWSGEINRNSLTLLDNINWNYYLSG